MELITAESPARLVRLYREYHRNELISLHYNYTGKLQASSKYRGGLKAEAVAFLALCALIVLENLVVLLAIWRNKKFHAPMFFLLGNLTLSDLLAGLAYAANIAMSGWPQADEGGGGAGTNYRGPTMLHMFLCFSVVSLFVDCF
uniref:G-protein coupled receptors family 1 profile domain-containing protein n=1 Tax=Chelydra serpentina TaxID=8475 RepID=A0A8C3S9Y8_CHESE